MHARVVKTEECLPSGSLHAGLVGVSGAHDLAPLRDGILLAEHEGPDGAAAHEVDQAVEERLPVVLRIEFLRAGPRKLQAKSCSVQ